MTDPSGYFFKSLVKGIKKYWKVAVAAVATFYTASLASGWAANLGFVNTSTFVAGGASVTVNTLSIGGYIFSGAVAGSVGGAIATGSLRGAATGAVTGAVFGGIGAFGAESGWNKSSFVGAHATAGGILADLQGGNFGHGFFSAGFMKGVGMGVHTSDIHEVGQTLIMAIVGGTVSRITGGKFANGAMTTAIQFVVNQLGSSNTKRQKLLNSLSDREKALLKNAIAVSDGLFDGIEKASNWDDLIDGLNDSEVYALGKALDFNVTNPNDPILAIQNKNTMKSEYRHRGLKYMLGHAAEAGKSLTNILYASRGQNLVINAILPARIAGVYNAYDMFDSVDDLRKLLK